jgi:hypothetical protein
MTDERLDQLLNGARDSYRGPPEPPLDEMWAAIEAERWPLGLHVAPAPRRSLQWRVAGIAAAAALVLGVGVGRWSAPRAPAPVEVASLPVPGSTEPRPVALSEPLQRTTANYLGEMVGLLKDMQNNPTGASPAQATSLLVTTRLLLDSPAAADARMRDLLEDLEQILAQVTMLRGNESNALRRQDVQMIRSALTERDVVPRVHTAVVTLASIDD